MKLFDELKRRNVFRVAGVYAVVGWLLAQAAGVLENALSMPGWFDTVAVSLLLLGFPVALVFAWAFELTPEGVKLTANVAEGDSIAAKTGRTLDYAILAGLALVFVVAIANRFVGGARPIADGGARARGGANSIAVLPFADMSPLKDQEYFSDGMSEELLNVLAQVKGLEVAGRTSSFAFKDKNTDLREIGEILNVANIVEGSVRKDGLKVRITVQLIKAKDGYHVWSQTYDRELNDIFAVQDDISKAILKEITQYLPGAAAQPGEAIKQTPRADIGAYDLFLQARDLINQIGGMESYEKARSLLDQAIAIDANYAPALAWRAYAESALSESWAGVGDTPIAEALPAVKAFADRAVAADSNSAEAYFALGAYYAGLYMKEGATHLDEAISAYRRALAIRPNFSQAQRDLAYFLSLRGDYEESVDILQSVLKHDPAHRDSNEDYIFAMLDLGRFDDAQSAIDRWTLLRPDLSKPQLFRAEMLLYKGEIAAAHKLLSSIEPADEIDTSRLKRLNSIINFILGETAFFAANDNRPIFQAFASLIDGDAARASEIIANDPAARRNPHAGITVYAPIMYAVGDYEAVAQYYEEFVKTPEAAIAAIDACGCGGMDALVPALRKAGRKDAEKLLRLWGEMAARKSAIFAKASSFHALEGSRAALNGDFAKSKAEFATAMDLGWRDPLFMRRYFTFDDLPDDPQFTALVDRMRRLINAEREALGLAPAG